MWGVQVGKLLNVLATRAEALTGCGEAVAAATADLARALQALAQYDAVRGGCMGKG